MQIKNEILGRIYVVLALVVLFATVTLIQTIRIAIMEQEKWLAEAERTQFKAMEVEAERGNIISTDGSLLATSLPYYDIYFDPLTPSITNEVFNNHVRELARLIVLHFDSSYTASAYEDKLRQARLSGDRYVLIKRDINHPELELLKTFPIFNRGRYKGGLIAEEKPIRKRPFGILANRTIGYVRDSVQVGLEGYFNDVLGGQSGKQLMRRIKGRNGESIWIPSENITEISPVEGMDIQSTLDVNLQDITEKALIRGLQKSNAKWGTAILMEVQTGAVCAIANIGKTSDGWWEDYNYAVGSPINPGSTFKLATAMALFETGKIDLDDTVELFQGKHQFYEEEMVDASYHGLHKTTFRKAFEMSSNVGMAYQVNKHFSKTPEEYIRQLKKFNLDLPTGIEIPGERNPYIRTPKDELWSGITLPWLSIGYEAEQTPIGIATFYNAVANGGKMMKPYLVQEIIKDGQTEKTFKPTVVNAQIASPATIKKAQELLEGVVENGTAKKLRTDIYRFAGKTGTAQVDYSQRSNMKHQASFAGYFPAENPKYTCVVVINKPQQGSIYGGDVAGPVFREIADKTYSSKIDLQPPLNAGQKPVWRTFSLPDLNVGEKDDLAYLLRQLGIPFSDDTPSRWALLRAEADTLSMQTRRVTTGIVPNVLGMGMRDAIYILENNGLKVTVSGLGKVRRQSVPAGRKIQGQTIHLTLS